MRSPTRRHRTCRRRTAARSAQLDRSQTAIAALSTSRGLRCAQGYAPTREKHMDFSKFKPSDWLMVAGGRGHADLRDRARLGEGAAAAQRRTEPFDLLLHRWDLVAARRGGRCDRVPARGGIIKPGSVPWSLLLVPRHRVALHLLMLICASSSVAGDRGRVRSSIVGSACTWRSSPPSSPLVGAVMNYKATGGDLNDLKDFNKIKGAFAKPADSAPPPPPPPPPPPAV